MSAGVSPKQTQAREVAYQVLKDALLDGRFSPAQHLVEHALAEQLGVSKTPVREALTRLEQEGLVDWFPNRGFFVREYTEQDVQEIYELREIYEAACVRFATERPDRAELAATLREENERARAAFGSGEIDEVHRHFSRFDGVIFERHDNRLLQEEIAGVQARIYLSGVTTNRIPGRIERSLREHEAIILAVESGDPAGAEAATRAHIRSLLDDELAYRRTSRPSGPWRIN